MAPVTSEPSGVGIRFRTKSPGVTARAIIGEISAPISVGPSSAEVSPAISEKLPEIKATEKQNRKTAESMNAERMCWFSFDENGS